MVPQPYRFRVLGEGPATSPVPSEPPPESAASWPATYPRPGQRALAGVLSLAMVAGDVVAKVCGRAGPAAHA